jgi:drug/metabolite transporter (DMT)-like permease
MKKAFIQLHLAVFIAGFTAILGKLIQINEGLLVWYRLFLSIIILGIFMIFKKQHEKISFKNFMQIAVVGFILAIHWVTFYGSVKYANASIAVVCISGAGFFSAFLEPIILRKKLVWIELLLGVIAILGISIIFNFHPHFKVGIIFGIISAIGSAAFPIFNKRLLEKFSAQTLTFYEFSGGLMMLTFFLPIYFIAFKPHVFIPSSMDWLWLIILSAICTVLAFILQLNALKKISAFTSNLTYNLEPLYGVILATIIFNEHEALSGHFYTGFLLILLSVIIQMFRVSKKNKAQV